MHTNRPNPFLNRKPLQPGGRRIFLDRVRKALDHGETSPAPAGPPPALNDALTRQVETTEPREALITRWLAKAKGNSIIAERLDSPSVAMVHSAITRCFAKHKIARCILNARELTTTFALPGCLAANQIEALQWGAPECREKSFHCDAAITDCRAGLADAGSLMVWSDDAFGRSSTLVIPVHIILLPASRMLPDLIDGLQYARQFAQKTGTMLPSNIVIINGPSKTADIEMNLVTGVHGPKFVYVLLLDGL